MLARDFDVIREAFGSEICIALETRAEDFHMFLRGDFDPLERLT